MILSFTKKVLNNFESITIYSLDGKEKIKVIAKVDTGADSTSIDIKLAKKLGLLEDSNIIKTKKYKSGLGVQERKIIHLKYKIKNKIIKTQVSVIDRSHLKYRVLIGIKDMTGFLVNPDRS